MFSRSTTNSPPVESTAIAVGEHSEVGPVPGSFETPVLANKMADSGKYDAIICLGAIIRGETPHFDFIASEAAKGVAKVAMDSKVPCVFGIITTDNLEQALDRAGTKSGNKGRDAARTAIEMCSLYSEI